MSFILGLDVGTASGAGATKRDGRVQPCALGDRTATIPAVVVLDDDGTTLVGEDAERIAGLELTRIARDIRLDPAEQTTPISVGGHVHTPYELLRTMYSTLVERVCLSYNAAPAHIVLTHPAVPEGMRCEMIERIAEELFPGALVVPEPIAATVKLACDGTLPPDCVIAVYDLGGGTFDISLVRREGDRFSVLGDPSGMPNFGGIDVDDLVLDHVDRQLDGAVAQLDLTDPEAVEALTRLRVECRDAKERLSYETEVTIDASLPGHPALVRLTRSQFDSFLLPGLETTVDVFERVIADAGLQSRDVDIVALVGGSSRIPLVADLLSARTSIPILVDPYPELTVALGAAQMVDDETPSSSVFPFADLALPSLTALNEAGGPAHPRDYEPVGHHAQDADTGRLLGFGPPPGEAPASAVGRVSVQSLNPKLAVGALACVVALLLVSLLLLGGGDGNGPEAAEAQNARSGGTTTTVPSTTGPPSSTGDDVVTPPGSTSTTRGTSGSTTTTRRPTTTGSTSPGATNPPGTPPTTGSPPTNPPTTPTTAPPTTTPPTTAPPTTAPPTTAPPTTAPPTTTPTTTSSSSTSSSSTAPRSLQPTLRADQGAT